MKDKKEINERLKILEKMHTEMGLSPLFNEGYYRYISALKWVLDEK